MFDSSSFFSVHNEVAKVMFLHMSVHSVHGGGGAIPACIAGGIPACLAAGLQGGCLLRGGLLPGGWRPPQKQTATVCGRYASYWNAFLLLKRNITGLGNRVRLSSVRNDHTIQRETSSVTGRYGVEGIERLVASVKRNKSTRAFISCINYTASRLQRVRLE